MPDIIIPTPLNPTALTGVTSTGALINILANPDGSLAVSSAGAAGADRELVNQIWYTLIPFTGASRGDVISQTQILDVTGTPSTVGVVWRNLTTGLDLASAPSMSVLSNSPLTSLAVTSQTSFSRPANTTAYTRGDLVSSSVSPGLPLEFSLPYPGALIEIVLAYNTSVSIAADAIRLETYALDLFLTPPTVLIGDNAPLWDPTSGASFASSTLSGITDANYLGRLFSGGFVTEITTSVGFFGPDQPLKTIIIPSNGKIYGLLSMSTDSQISDGIGGTTPSTSVSGQTFTLSLAGKLV